MTTVLNLLRSQRGQVLPISAILVVSFLGFTGLVIDGGVHISQRRQAQNGADEAAVAGARELLYGGSAADARTAALQIADANGFDNNGSSNIVTVNIPPVSGEFAGNASYVQVEIHEDPTTFFIHSVLGDTAGVGAQGVAGVLDACRRDEDEDDEDCGDPGGSGSPGCGSDTADCGCFRQNNSDSWSGDPADHCEVTLVA